MSDTDAPTDGVAAAWPATRQSLRRRWTVVAVLAVFAVALLVLAAVIFRADAQAVALQSSGTQAPATVTAIDAKPVGRGGFTDGSVTVQFTVAGQPQQASVYVGNAIDQYQTGQPVTVVYDPSNLSRVELVGITTPPPGLPLAVPLILGVILLGMTLAVGRHAWRIARVLRREPWESVASAVHEVPPVNGFRRIVVDLTTSSGAVRVEPIGFSRVDESFAPLALAAGVDGTLIVLAKSDGSRALGVRRRGRTSARRAKAADTKGPSAPG